MFSNPSHNSQTSAWQILHRNYESLKIISKNSQEVHGKFLSHPIVILRIVVVYKRVVDGGGLL